jgi:hypothetical protein
MTNVIEVSYTGDLLAHRRCPRAWAYEKYAGFYPYEQVQAMEGRLVHHAMEWLTTFRAKKGRHAKRAELEEQLNHYFRVLWARGIRTAFTSKTETIDRVVNNLFPPAEGKQMHPTVRAAIEGAQHTEYELRTVRKLVPLEHDGKERLLLTGILDLVVQQEEPLSYKRIWEWIDVANLRGKPVSGKLLAKPGDLEIWDYKGTRGNSEYLNDYALQLLTYANLYRERSGVPPVRCVLFFINEPKREEQLLAIPIDSKLLEAALQWTINCVKQMQKTMRAFQAKPCSIEGGDGIDPKTKKPTVSDVLSSQCTACGQRFGCTAYEVHLGNTNHPDIRLDNVYKN